MKISRNVILFCVLCLLALGLVMLWSIDATARGQGQSSSFFWRQLAWAGYGLAIMLLVARLEYGRWRRFTLPLLGLGAGLLIVSSWFGMQFNVARQQQAVAVGAIDFRPAQACVVATVLFLAHFLANWGRHVQQIPLQRSSATEPITLSFSTCVPFFAIFSVWSLLLRSADSSLGLVLVLAGLVVLLFGGMRWRWIAMYYGGLAVGFVCFLRCDSMRWARLTHFFFSHDEVPRCRPIYEMVMNRGGWLGVGLGNGQASDAASPFWATDFIASLIGEQLGWLGLICLVLLYAALIGAGLSVSVKARDRFGFLMGLGLTSIIGLQALMNLAVVTSLLPLRAPALPFVSYGGADLCLLLACVGLLLSIARHADQPDKTSGSGSATLSPSS